MNYQKYQFQKKDWFVLVAGFIVLDMIISILFYNSYLVMFLMIPLFIPYFIRIKKSKSAKQQELLNYQFKEFISSISSSLQVGYSMESSIKNASSELKQLLGEKSMMVEESLHMIHQMDLNIPPEEIFLDFAKRSDNEEIKSFADVFLIAKKTGGNLVSIIKNTEKKISSKIEVQQEISVIISGKKMEQRIMSVMPFGILIYVRITSPYFLDQLYGTPFGIVLMSSCLVIYTLAYYIGNRIVDIQM